MKNKFAVLAALAALVCSGTAFADECDDLNNNPEWKDGLAQVKTAFESNDYDTVLSKGEELNFICARSPEVNYYIGATYAAKGDNDNARVYLEIASDATYEFATSPELAKKIFYARYEAENPQRTEAYVKSLQDALKLSHTTRKIADAHVESLEASLAEKENLRSDTSEGTKEPVGDVLCQNDSNAYMEYRTYMWAGVGVGVFGVVTTVVGGALIGKMDKYEHTGFHEGTLNEFEAKEYGRSPGKVNLQDYKISSGYVAGWTLLGVGLTATVTGIVLAGVNGYKVMHSDDTYSFGISPNGVSFGMTF